MLQQVDLVQWDKVHFRKQPNIQKVARRVRTYFKNWQSVEQRQLFGAQMVPPTRFTWHVYRLEKYIHHFDHDAWIADGIADDFPFFKQACFYWVNTQSSKKVARFAQTAMKRYVSDVHNTQYFAAIDTLKQKHIDVSMQFLTDVEWWLKKETTIHI